MNLGVPKDDGSCGHLLGLCVRTFWQEGSCQIVTDIIIVTV